MSPAPGTGAPDVRTGFTAAVAHRAADRDVLVRGLRAMGDDAYTLDLDWSGPHLFFGPARGSVHHHMLIAQTLRQIGLALAHTEFAIGPSHHFLMNDLTYAVDPRHRTDLSPLRAEASCTWTARNAVRVAISLIQRGTTFLTSDSSFSWVSDRGYRRLRGPRLESRPGPRPFPVPPSATGRHTPDEVVLGPSERPHCWELIPDTGNPALIDHPVDHVPGLVIMEAVHQAAFAFIRERTGGAGTGWCPVSTAMYADRYVEFDAPCWIEARAVPPLPPGAGLTAPPASGDPGVLSGILTAGMPAVELTGRQRGAVVFRSVVEGVLVPD
ncbi:ScbA/BarX family gamma-butyrolactone biosynthesis protein [uncultured Streptomyces sp.]|uniref:ScbA/BarX family gamma-butyrolactone biosynthesis protein n=1 Tax=uncultured Streptomyces sp. TaxID=174707 RepID=UPI00261A11AF|nr:ScbA/BarX family gamma-butyrolactone biosynthesis protein [uncultured Streptomyces sp.]